MVTEAEYQQAKLRDLCRQSFDAFAQKAFSLIEPGTQFIYNWHIGCIADHLTASFNGELPRLIINVPPRALKSMLTAQFFPSWVLGKQPWHQFIGASYAHTLAERNVVKARQVMQSDFYMSLFPKTVISADQNKKDYFTTDQGGQYKGTGIGGTLTGFGAHTLVIDDPLNPKEGMSDTIRGSTNDEIRSTLFSRFNDSRTGRVVMIMQRIHDDDPTGNLIRDGGWHLLKLPAEAKEPISISLGSNSWRMDAGQLLDPVRSPKAVLEQKRTDLGDANYVGQYLQEPAPIGGGEFKDHWLQFYQQGGIKPREMNLVLLVDAAGGEETNRKKRKLSDWTAMEVIGLAPDNNYYLLDMVRDRLNPKERVDTVFMLMRKWQELSGKMPKCGYEKYGMMTDTFYIREKQRDEAYNFPLIELGGSMQKEERIRRLIPDMQNGRWWLPSSLIYIDGEGRRFDLIRELIDVELKSFPRSRFDDMLDAMSRIYEPDLSMAWPKGKISMVNKALSKYDAEMSEPTSWRDW